MPLIEPRALPRNVDALHKIVCDLCEQLKHESSETETSRSVTFESRTLTVSHRLAGHGNVRSLPPLLSVRDLRYSYPDGTVALDGVNFELRAGECVILLGPNGSGKTTFILHLNGLLRGQGEVIVAGRRLDPAALGEIRRKVGIVFQDADDQLFLLSVLEDVAFGPLNLGQTPDEAIHAARQALCDTGMEWAEEKAPYQLSGGEKRRVAIAGVLAMQPDILVLDEPTTSLDPPSQYDLVAIVRNLPQAKIVATHDTAFASAIGTRAVFFQHGRIVAEGSVRDLANRFNWCAAEPKP